MEHSSGGVTRYRVVLDRRKRDDVRLLLFKPDAHFKARYPLSLVQEGKVNSSEAPIPEHELSILGASIRGEVMDLQMNRLIMYVVFERGVRECHSFMFLLCHSNHKNISLVSLTRTPRKSLENHLIMMNT